MLGAMELLNQLVDKLLFRLQKESSSSKPGLLDGDLGIAIALFEACRILENSKIREAAYSLIDETYERMNQDDLSFASGLSGIGWGINYLIEQGYVSGNVNHVLSEIDDLLLKNILSKNRIFLLTLSDGLSGFLLYINKRLMYSSSKRRIALEESLRLLIDRIWDEGFRSFSFIGKDIVPSIFDPFSSTIYALAESYKLNIYNEKIEAILQLWMYVFDTVYPRLHTNRLLLAVSLRYMSNVVKMGGGRCPYYSASSSRWNDWLGKMDTVVSSLLFATNMDEVRGELDISSFKLEDGWHGYVWLLWQAEQILCHDIQCDEIHALRETILGHVRFSFVEGLDKVQGSIPMPVQTGLAGFVYLMAHYPEVFRINSNTNNQTNN